MVRSDGWGNGLQPSRLCETLGVFEFIVCYGYFDLQCIMGVVMLGGGKKEVIGSSYSLNILMIPSGLPNSHGNRVVTNLLNELFLRKEAKFLDG